MAVFNATKVVGALPVTLEPNTLYLVRVGEGFDFYCSDATGAIAHKVNSENNSSNLPNPIGIVFQSIQPVTYNQGGTSTLNNSTHNTFTLTANGTGTTIAHSNVPATGRYGFELHLTWVSGTITWPASWTKGDSPPTAIGSYVISGITIDGGNSWKITILAE